MLVEQIWKIDTFTPNQSLLYHLGGTSYASGSQTFEIFCSYLAEFSESGPPVKINRL